MGREHRRSTGLSSDGYWPLFDSLYGGKGLLIGWVLLDEKGQISGKITWLKPAATKAFLQSRTNTVGAAGNVYGASTSLSAGSVVLSGGALDSRTLSTTFTVDAPAILCRPAAVINGN